MWSSMNLNCCMVDEAAELIGEPVSAGMEGKGLFAETLDDQYILRIIWSVCLTCSRKHGAVLRRRHHGLNIILCLLPIYLPRQE